MEKQTLAKLMDSAVPSWDAGDVVIAFAQRGIVISKDAVYSHRGGTKPNANFRKIYCEIFQKTEEEIQWQSK